MNLKWQTFQGLTVLPLVQSVQSGFFAFIEKRILDSRLKGKLKGSGNGDPFEVGLLKKLLFKYWFDNFHLEDMLA